MRNAITHNSLFICLTVALACGGSLDASHSPSGGDESYSDADSYGGESVSLESPGGADDHYAEAEEAMPMAASEDGADHAAPRRSSPADVAGATAAAASAPTVATAGAPAPATPSARLEAMPAGESVTVTVDAPVMDYEVAPEPPQQQRAPARLLTAASVADHDRRGNYQDYLARHLLERRQLGLDMSRRLRIRVIDGQGEPINDAQVQVAMQSGNRAQIEGRTHADGRWDFFPGVHGVAGPASIIVTTHGRRLRQQVFVNGSGDSQGLEFRVPVQHSPRPRALDLAFLIDVTGSMEDELRYVNREVSDIVARVREQRPETNIRVGAVFYRDRTDSQPLQRIQFTRDISGFANAMTTVRASGGGDYPEDLNAGLATAIDGLQWREGDVVRVLCVIADAPPKRYAANFTYQNAMVESARRGIRILPVAASGADRQVEYLFRALGTFTSSPYVYLTDDSGVGNPHMEADTDRVAVEYFNDLLTRVVVSDLRAQGMHEPAGFQR